MVALSDEKTLMAQMKSGLGLKPIDRKINWVEKINVQNLAEIIICDVTEEKETFRKILFLKMVDDTIEARVYTEDSNFRKGNRKDLMENAGLWVTDTDHVFFDQPKDITGLNDLKYTAAFQLGDLIYSRKEPGEYEGEFRQTPGASGMSYPMLVSICEYSLVTPENVNKEVPPQAMFLEVGSYESEEGGLIALWYGYGIEDSEFQVLPC